MAFNGSGTFVRLYNWVQDKANSIKITASRMDAEMDGMATGLSTCITKDGQSTPTANIPLGGFKITNLGNGSASTDACTYGQLQAGTAIGNGTITIAQLANVTNDSVYIGNHTGVPTSLVLGNNSIHVTNATGVQSGFAPGNNTLVTGNATGVITALSPSNNTVLTANGTGVLSALSVGNASVFATNATGVQAGITGTNGTVLMQTGGVPAFGNNYSAGQSGGIDVINVSSSNLTIDCAIHKNAVTLNMTSNATLQLVNATNSTQRMHLSVKAVQDATGGRVLSVNTSVYKCPGGTIPVLSTGANKTDFMTLIVENSLGYLSAATANFA